MPITTTIDFSAPTSIYVILRGGVGGVLTVQVLQGGTPVDLTGAAIRYMAAPPLHIDKSVGLGIDILQPATNGTFTITYTAADTAGQNVERGVAHECKLQQLHGVPIAVFEGRLMVEHSLFTDI